LRKEAYLIRGVAAPAIQKPSLAPVLFTQKDGFTWRGATGAAYYIIERAVAAKGPWKVLATGLEDSVLADVVKFESSPEASEPLVLFADESADKGKTYYYRIKGVNVAGESAYSHILKVTK
jgi:mannan endo-1,4-beta-mannosidase